MPTSTLREFDEHVRLHASEPILERRSHMHGTIRVYPPAADPSEWADHSWLITTEGTADVPGISARIKAESVPYCYDRPHFVDARHKFVETA